MNKAQYKDYIMSFRYVEYEEDKESGGISLIIEGSILNKIRVFNVVLILKD